MKIHIEVEIEDNINLTEIEAIIKKQNVNQKILIRYFNQLQTKICEELAGKKNSRKNNLLYKYESSKMKKLKTEFGTIEFKQIRIKPILGGKIETPINPYLKRIKNKFTFLDKQCLILAKNSSYEKTKEFLDFTSENPISKSTIYKKVQNIGSKIKNKYLKEIKNKDFDVISADGTKTHSLTVDKNEVRVSIGFEKNKLRPTLLDVTINENWASVAKKIDHHIKDDTTILADGEKGISIELSKEKSEHNMCNRHFITGLNYRLWKDNLPLKLRNIFVKEGEKIIYEMNKSLDKFEKHNNSEIILQKLEKSKEEIGKLANKILKEKCKKTHKYVLACKDSIFTYVKKRLIGIYVNYMSNDIERTMLEVGRRTKKKGMHWSEKGLETLLYSVLLSYFDKPKFYQILKSI
jgi:hypothetical protein